MTRKVRQIHIHGNIAFVTLTKGYVATIDASCVHMVEGFNWTARTGRGKVYAIRNVRDATGRQVPLQMHRVIAGTPAGFETDHIDGDGLNNLKANLRAATHAENVKNAKIRNDNASGNKGVHWDAKSRKWRAQIGMDGKRIYLGLFASLDDAAIAYRNASAVHHRTFGRVD